jgi:hypothetical protein
MKGMDASEGGLGGSEVLAVPAQWGLLSTPNNCIGIIAAKLDLPSFLALAATCKPLWAVLNSEELLPPFIMAMVKHRMQRCRQRVLGQIDQAYEDQVRRACKAAETRSMDVLRHAMGSLGWLQVLHARIGGVQPDTICSTGKRRRTTMGLIKYGSDIGSATTNPTRSREVLRYFSASMCTSRNVHRRRWSGNSGARGQGCLS